MGNDTTDTTKAGDYREDGDDMTKRGRMARDDEEPNQKAQETFVSWATGILNFFSSLRTVTVSQLLPLLARRREGVLIFFFHFFIRDSRHIASTSQSAR